MRIVRAQFHFPKDNGLQVEHSKPFVFFKKLVAGGADLNRIVPSEFARTGVNL